jgi:hypothetical protein
LSKLVDVTAVGLSSHEKLLFSLRLETIRLADGTGFVYTDDASATLIVANPDSNEGRAAIARAATVPNQGVILCGARRTGVLQVEAPFRTAPMQLALSTAISLLRPDAATASERIVAANHDGLTAALQALLESQLKSTPMQLIGFHNLNVILFPQSQTATVSLCQPHSGKWWDHLQDHSAIFLSPAPGATARDSLIAYDTLRWHLALQLSNGLLLPRIAGRTHFGFKTWPNFGALGATRDHMRIAALLVNRALTLPQLCQTVGCARPQVVAFLNACALVGKLSATSETPELRRPSVTNGPSVEAATNAPPGANKGILGLLGKLREALTLTRR